MQRSFRVSSVKVVLNITAFYTYWKATRDAFRKLAKTEATTVVSASTPSDEWHRAMGNVLYMQFLSFESARRAVRDLVEFEPNNAENTIMILLSELPLWRSLLKRFPQDDVRHTRLELRRSRYQDIVPQVYYLTQYQHAKYNDPITVRKQFPHLARHEVQELCRDWDKAYGMLRDLKSRYEAAIGTFPSKEAVAEADRI